MAQQRRTEQEIIADPQASEEEVCSLSTGDAQAHPNCPEGLWWAIARSYPIEAMLSPAYEIMLLESPQRWMAMVEELAYSWIPVIARDRLTIRERQLWACDCVAYAAQFMPPDTDTSMVRVVLSSRRQFIDGKITPAQWKKVQNQIANLRSTCFYNKEMFPLFAAIYDPLEATEMVANAGDAQARIRQRTWQWNRLLQYVRGEV